MPRHALDPSVAFGNDTESTIPWSSVSSSVAVLEYGSEATPAIDATDPTRTGRHRKSTRTSKSGRNVRSILADQRFHAGATLGLMGTIFLPQLTSANHGPGSAGISAVSIEPEAAVAPGAQQANAPAGTPANKAANRAARGRSTPGGTAQGEQYGKHALRADGLLPRAQAERELEAWTRQNAKLGIPARALRAYVNAEHAMDQQQPSCGLRWNLLAGVGRIESNHGRFAGRRLKDNGMPSQSILGVPLDGSSGVRAIYDTDGGRMDGDATYDRAVGPMQFIPSTWDKWAEDGNGDGRSDPQNLDDAALTAANYLCGHGSGLDTEQGQRAALYGYNNSYEYGEDVLTHAAQYMAGVKPLPVGIYPGPKHAARDA